jgi:hypothetical protein
MDNKNVVIKEHGALNRISPDIVKVTKDEAQRLAREEAQKSGVSPSAVMHSYPDGAVTGEQDVV